MLNTELKNWKFWCVCECKLQVRCTVEHPAVMIWDNHDSHPSIEALDYAKANGIVTVTIHRHCSHKVQPLDCTVFGPFKRYYDVAVKSWMLDNPGKAMTIYNIPQMVAVAFARSMTIENISSSFRVTGIYPFDPNVHSQSYFAPSLITDRSNPDVPISNRTCCRYHSDVQSSCWPWSCSDH